MAKRQKTRGSGDASGPTKHGEQRSGPVAGTAIVTGVTFASKGLQYAEVDGEAIFEGDIVLGPADSAGDLPQRSIGVTPGANNARRWPSATIPFEIDAALPNKQRVHDAIAHWHANTRIRLRARTAQDTDFVRFVPGGGCSSMVGRQGGAQNITLGASCTTGNTIHEIGHTVGLWHEQSREDRDTFVQIVWANIDPAMQHNFNQHIADGDDLGAYDYGSIMHYPATAFSINGQATIVARQQLPPGVTMGQRTGLSAIDIAGVHAMYPGLSVTIKELSKDPVTDPLVTTKEVSKDVAADPTVKEVAKDAIRDPVTIKELTKDPISDPTVKEVRKDPVADPTIKEVGRDPFIPGGQVVLPGVGGLGGASPFVLASPSRFGQPGLADAEAQVQQLALAIAQVEQQHAELVAAYDAAVQALAGLSGQ